MTTTVRKLLKDIIPKEPSALFFPGKKGGKINQISSNFFKIVNCMGLNDGVTDRRQRISFHTCRHSFASWLAIQGTPLYTISKMLGHKSMAMTERYAHLSPDIKRTAIDNLDAVFNGKIKISEIKAEG